jgi:hypothetical protein
MNRGKIRTKDLIYLKASRRIQFRGEFHGLFTGGNTFFESFRFTKDYGQVRGCDSSQIKVIRTLGDIESNFEAFYCMW